MHYILLKLVVVLMGFALSLSVQAANELALIKPKGKDYRAGSDPIEITLGDTISQEIWPNLHLEIDSIDVTEFIALANGRLQYIPQEPLSFGQHQIRLVAAMPDGNIEELANWQIETRASATFLESTIQSNLDLQITQRIDDNYSTDTVSKTQGQGSYTFASNQSTGDWRLTTNADLIYNSQRDQTQNGRKLDVNEFNLKSEWSQSTVTLGHQTLPVNSLVMTDFNRRGVSASYRTESNNAEVAGFRTRTEMITGFENGLGIGNEKKRTTGAYVRVNPVSETPEKMIVTGIYLDGRGSPEGQAEESDEATKGEGEARAIIVESYLDKKRVYVRGEYASSSFDFDGVDAGYAAEDDHASSLFVQYATERNEGRTEANNWSAGLLHQRIGQWFHSLGNAALPADKKTSQILTTFSSEQWQINANAALEENNVDNDVNIPVIETRMLTANVTYTPQSNPDKPQSGMFSNPSYTFGFTHNNNEQTVTPVGFAGDAIKQKNYEISLLASFSGDGWNWSLSHMLSKEEDVTNVYSDTENEVTSLEANLPVNENFTLSPVIQTSSSRDIDTGLVTDIDNAGINMQYSNNDDISIILGYTMSHEVTNDGSNDARSKLAEVTATWAQQQATHNKFGYSYFTRASRQDNDILGIKSDTYQVFLGINLTWPATF